MSEWAAGAEIHGFADGYFGRDSYSCRVVESVGADWLVTRNTQGEAEFVTIERANRITAPDGRDFCHDDCDPRETSNP